jgi:hypothetical protein
MRTLDGFEAENRRALARIEAGANDRFDHAVLAYTIHNIYCLMENYFLRVAKTFENHVEGDAWHKDLVRRMSIEIDGMRPALLDDETAYMSPLNSGKVLELQKKVPSTLESFHHRSTEFIEKLRRMIGTA